jgi:hypothetical protein
MSQSGHERRISLFRNRSALPPNSGPGGDIPEPTLSARLGPNQADFEPHNAMPYVKAWFAKLPELADGDVKAMRMEILAGHRD